MRAVKEKCADSSLIIMLELIRLKLKKHEHHVGLG